MLKTQDGKNHSEKDSWVYFPNLATQINQMMTNNLMEPTFKRHQSPLPNESNLGNQPKENTNPLMLEK